VSSSARFIGRGLAFPLRTSATGGIAMVEDHHDLDEAIRLIVGTAPGERPMRPAFGCRIHEHVFAPINDTTVGTIVFEVEQAIARWEPRVDVASVDVYADDDDTALLYVEVGYRVKQTNDERNLVFPFYVIPEED
jgi:uncharacterized protein